MCLNVVVRTYLALFFTREEHEPNGSFRPQAEFCKSSRSFKNGYYTGTIVAGA